MNSSRDSLFYRTSINAQDRKSTGKVRSLNGYANHAVAKADGGGGGIRTLETLARLPVFKTGAFNHSATPPGISASPGHGVPPTFY
jgi:hypothetical protein